jgi:hypothetical protein
MWTEATGPWPALECIRDVEVHGGRIVGRHGDGGFYSSMR